LDVYISRVIDKSWTSIYSLLKGRGGPNPTLKGLNVKRSNERSEIIAPGETWGRAYQKGPNPERVEYEEQLVPPGKS
jgi:hypothetical protein